MSDMQSKVQAAIDAMVADGREIGLAVAVYRDGERIADAVAGVADTTTGRLVTSDTPFWSASTGKALTATVVHVLAEQGVLDYDTPIAHYWPEFAAHGKEKATLRHALTHTTGVPGVPVATTVEDLCDWDKMCAAIAAETPWWEPGTRTGYHAQSYGYIIGEIVRRATGKPISAVLREQVAGPLGVADELFFGVPRSVLPRVARLQDADEAFEMPPGMSLEDMPFFRVVDGYTAAPMAAMPDAAFGNREDVLLSDIPAGGTFSARAIARMYAALLGPVDGVRLISPERLLAATSVAFSGTDELFGFPVQRGLGFDLGMMPPLDRTSIFTFGGSGGSGAFADRASGIACAMTKNRFMSGSFDSYHTIAHLVMREAGAL